jgi:hypothetical protein
MVTDPRRSLATNPVNLGFCYSRLPSRITSRLPVDLHSVFSRFPHDLLSTSCRRGLVSSLSVTGWCLRGLVSSLSVTGWCLRGLVSSLLRQVGACQAENYKL